MILEFSFDDAVPEDVRTAELLRTYGFRGTFFVPTNHKINIDDLLHIAERHTIGGHTSTHPADLKKLSDEDLNYEIATNRAYLQDLTGQKINDFCYPRGRYDERVIEAVKNAGYQTARTTIVLKTDDPIDPYRKHTTIHCSGRGEYGDMEWHRIARSMFRMAQEKQGYFHVWGHSWELEKEDDWSYFEGLLDYIKQETWV